MCLISNKRGGNSSPVCFLKAPLPAPHVCFASLLGAGKPLLAPQLPPELSTLEKSRHRAEFTQILALYPLHTSKNTCPYKVHLQDLRNPPFCAVQLVFIQVSQTHSLMPPSQYCRM